MHAISPQVMVWDPSTVGMPAQTSDMQAQVLQTVIPSHGYRVPDPVPQIFAPAPVQSPVDQGGLVWIQHPQVIQQEETESPAMAQGFVPGQIPVQQHGLMPVLMSINGQRVLVHQPVTQLPAHSPGFAQVQTEAAQHDGIHLVNVAGINHRIQQGVRLTSLPQDPRQTSLQVPNFQTAPGNPFDRPRLTPRRRNGHGYSPCDAANSWRRVSEERTLGGLNTAIRRRSQSADRDGATDDAFNNSSGSPSPNKRLAPTIAGFDMPNEFWKAPDARILRKLVDIIEYYFSDECLSKNGYMLKQLSNGESDGYISLRRVAALKRVKAQTRDLRTVAYAVQQSLKLEMDDEGSMIRRKCPLPENIEAPRFIRSVLAINLPKESPNVEDVTALFTPYGELTQVRVLRPGKTIPSYLKDYTAWVPDLGTRVCAVVEFENQDEAQKACREINMQNRGQNSLRVALLKPGARIRRTLYRKYKDESPESNGDNTESTIPKRDVENPQTEVVTSSNSRVRCLSDSSEGSTGNDITNDNNNNKNNNKSSSFHYDASGSGSDTGSDTDSIGPKSGICRLPPKHNSGGENRKKSHNSGDSGYSHSSSSDERDSVTSPTPLRKNSNGCKPGNVESGTAPVLRRSSPVQKKFVDGVPVGVERQPKGPLGDCKGFNEPRQVSS